MTRAEKYRQERNAVLDKMDAINAAVAADPSADGHLSEAQQAEWDGLKAKAATLKDAIAREEEIEREERRAPAVRSIPANGTRVTEVTEAHGRPAVITEVEGSAARTGEHRFVLDPGDELGTGFLVAPIVGLVRPPYTLGIAHDDPSIAPPDKTRYDACAPVPADFRPDRAVNVTDIPGGRYAVAPFVGTAHDIVGAWERVFAEWLPQSGYQPDDRPCFELYRREANVDAPPGTFTCELCLPVRPL